jgi:hypothetical protein
MAEPGSELERAVAIGARNILDDNAAILEALQVAGIGDAGARDSAFPAPVLATRYAPVIIVSYHIFISAQSIRHVRVEEC